MAAVPDIVPIAADQLPQERSDSSEWVICFKEKLEEAEQYSLRRPWKKWCIYQVPRHLRDVQENNKAYAPKTVSIGPHHLGSKQVQDMVIHKRVALNQSLGRTVKDLNIYLNSIKEIEQEARDCYQHKFEHLSSNDFVEMMVLDGCFISELLISYPDGKENGNPIFPKQRIINEILLDMVILENQIPLFVINRFFKLVCASGDPDEHIKDQVTGFVLKLFNPVWLTGKELTNEELDELKSSIQPDECLHVLDIFRRSLIYEWPQQDTVHRSGLHKPGQVIKIVTDFRREIIHRVTDLRGGGVKFRRRNSNCFWDIRFNNGVLEIPTIRIEDNAMTILLNVAAFERCHLKIEDAKIVSYVVFMKCLIRSPEDVGHLHNCGIIENILGDNAEIVDMFKSISKEISVSAHGGYYAELSTNVNAYCSHRRNVWLERVIQPLNNPWALISLMTTFMALLMTMIQSYYTVGSYYKSNS